jgi:protein-disulfide isomerase
MPPVPRPHGKTRGKRLDRTLVLAIVVAAVVAAALIVGSLVWSGGGSDGESQPPPGSLITDTSLVDGIEQQGTVLGDPAATVTLLQYEDLQCPYCRQYTIGLLPTVVDEYVRKGTVKVDFRGVDFLGEDSTQALAAVLAAAKQGKAWQLAELFFANQGEEGSGWVTGVLIRDLASAIDGLDVDRLERDADSDEVAAEIAKLREEAAERKVEGTPWFFVRTPSGELVHVPTSGLSVQKLRAALDAAIEG